MNSFSDILPEKLKDVSPLNKMNNLENAMCPIDALDGGGRNFEDNVSVIY